MAKKGDQLYYEAFVKCAEDGCKAAELLHNTLKNFDSTTLEQRLDEMHAIEHGADEKKHVVVEELMRAFITPLEREDIAELLHHIDDVTDCLEDVLIRVYVNNITAVRPDAIEFAALLMRCCAATKEALVEFPNFRKSKTLTPLVREIGALEEECDRAFIQVMRDLHTQSRDPLEIIAWREIYIYLEKCADACDHVAGSIERVIMKNS